MRTLASVGVISIFLINLSIAQAPSGARTIDISSVDIQTMIESGSGGPMKSINAGEHTVFAWLTTRSQSSGVTRGELHTQMTEVYYVLEGSGTLNTGGTMPSPRKMQVTSNLPGTEDVPTFSTPTYIGTAEGGVVRKISAGDVIVIPPGTVHFFESIETPSFRYINLRIDPQHNLHAPYVNPLLIN